jgi:hypothetical protein
MYTKCQGVVKWIPGSESKAFLPVDDRSNGTGASGHIYYPNSAIKDQKSVGNPLTVDVSISICAEPRPSSCLLSSAPGLLNAGMLLHFNYYQFRVFFL